MMESSLLVTHCSLSTSPAQWLTAHTPSTGLKCTVEGGGACQQAWPRPVTIPSLEILTVSTVETTEAEWATHTGFIFKPISIFTGSARVIHLVELKVARFALTQCDAIQVGADGGLSVTFWTLPLAQAARSKDPSLRPQELADFSRGPAGVDVFLDPVSQVKQCHIGGQDKGGL